MWRWKRSFWRRGPETHSALRLEGGFQYVPWSRSLHNIIKQFKLALLTQALNAAVSWGGKSHQNPPTTTSPSPTTLPRFPPQHMWIDNKKKRSFLHRHGRDCQEESVYSTALRSRWPASLTSYRLLQKNCEEVASQISFTGKTGQQLKQSEHTDCGIHSIWVLRHLNYLTQMQNCSW